MPRKQTTGELKLLEYVFTITVGERVSDSTIKIMEILSDAGYYFKRKDICGYKGEKQIYYEVLKERDQ